MKKKRLLTIFVVFLLCFSFVNQIISSKVLAQESQVPEKPKGLLQRLGKIATSIFMIFRLFSLTAAANPQVIEIGYNETVNFELGIINLDTNEFENYSGIPLEKSRFLTFDVLEYPSGNEYGKWQVVFDPPLLNAPIGTTVKINVSINLRSNRLADKPIQNGILKIRIHHTYVFGNIFRPPKGFPGFSAPPMKGLWTFLALFIGWGRLYSGKVITEDLDVNILVKVKPVHEVNFYSVPYMVFKPDEIVSIPVTLQNLGNYNDTYGFRVIGENDNIKYGAPSSITLAPGEVSDSYLAVDFPPSIFDYGTIHQIKIQVYSLDEENVNIAERIVRLESKGIYFSEISGFGILFLVIIFIFIISFVFYKRKRIIEDICMKPDKPWEIPEEKEYLEQLKQQDKKKYNETLDMMKDEYKSSLLWYENCVGNVLKPIKPKTEISKKEEKILFKKEEKPIKIKKEILLKKEERPIKIKEEILLKKEEKPVKKKKEVIKIIEEKEKIKEIKDVKVDEEKQKKERALQRIKSEQEKQKRKYEKSEL